MASLTVCNSYVDKYNDEDFPLLTGLKDTKNNYIKGVKIFAAFNWHLVGILNGY